MINKFQHSFLRFPITYFVIWSITLLLFIGLQYYFKDLNKKENIVSYFEKGVINELAVLQGEAERVALILNSETDDYWNSLDKYYSQSDRCILVYKSDSLIYWNNNSLSGDISNVQIDDFKMLETQTGWYLVRYEQVEQFHLYLATLLKSKFNVARKLPSVIQKGSWFNYDDLNITLDTLKATHKIYTKKGDFIFGLKYQKRDKISDKIVNVLFIIYLLGYIFLLLWFANLYYKLQNIFKYDILLYLFLVADILLLRLLEFTFHFPSILKMSYIFEKQFDIFISFNSAGDLIINSIIFLIIAIQLSKLLLDESKYFGKSISSQIILNTIVWIIGILLFAICYCVILQLPFNSFYGFELENYNAIYIISALLIFIISYFLLIHTVFTATKGLTISKIGYFIILGILIIIISSFTLNLNYDFYIIIGVFLLSLFLVYNYLSIYEKQEFYKYLFVIILISTTVALTINSARINKKNLHQLSTLQTLSELKDENLEKTFNDFGKMLVYDSILTRATTIEISDKKIEIKDYLIDTYFNDLVQKYDVQITLCMSEDMLELQPEGIVVNCSEYFENYINSIDKFTISDHLFLIQERPESIYYFGKERVNLLDSKLNIFIEFYFTYVPEGLGYPELLITEAAMDIDLSGYSIARYKNDQLAYKYGNFPYLTSFKYMEMFPTNALFSLHKFRHIKKQISDDSYLIISRPAEKLAVQLVSFSVLFIVFVIIIFIVSIVVFSKQAAHLFKISFQSRLQIIFVSAISFIIILLASITLFYINIDNQNRLTEQLTEKTNSVIIELQHKLSDVPDLYSIDPVELEILLKKFSLVFFSDINLYSPTGDLISTSRPEIFNRGLLSENINPKAFEELFIRNQLFYITLEELGSITYYSSYAPLMLNNDKPAGIINLPYFAKQSDVAQSYYQMIFTFINLFVFLGIIGTIIVLILSRLITKPLVVLQKNLAEIQIDKQNEIIAWKGNDEIGQLINAYNQMIVKLEQSTELLKQSERESAWREVAQQIAHEIKNPLTPMKLNVQYLEKAFREKEPGLDEKVKNISEMLIAQIETLNRVAEMFSDFTKTKSRKFEKVNLSNVIKKAILLFRNHSDTIFKFNADPGTEFYTKAFEKDVLRVFNNLIKNSIQSLDKQAGGTIEIKLNTIKSMHIVEFIDNGKGISDDIKTNIFKPYFTTKSTGTGLGLAIVKNIMNEIGGEITLESTTGKGTRFVLKFQSFVG